MISRTCFCNAVKYELSAESQMQRLCYCIGCQVLGGSAHWTSYAMAPANFHLLAGSMTAYTYDPGSGREATRHFCDTCFAQIMVQSDALGMALVNAMAFDDPSAFNPEITYFTDSAPKWC